MHVYDNYRSVVPGWGRAAVCVVDFGGVKSSRVAFFAPSGTGERCGVPSSLSRCLGLFGRWVLHRPGAVSKVHAGR